MSAKDHFDRLAAEHGWTVTKTDDWIRHFTKPGEDEVYVEYDARGGIIYASGPRNRRSLRRSDVNKFLTVLTWLGLDRVL